MPTYSFENKKTGEIFDEFMSIADREKYLKKNKNIKQILTPSHIVRDVDGARRVDAGFTDLLKQIKHGNPRSTVNVR